jgi:hypothetical protein
MVERFHRQLKAAIVCHGSERWTDALPMVLLGIRAAWREDLKTSAAELVYGQPLALPGEFVTEDASEPSPEHEGWIRNLRRKMSEIRAGEPHHHGRKSTFVFKELSSTTSVFLRRDALKPALTPAYDGPYRVLERGPKTFTIQVGERRATVSIDRVKPAYILPPQEEAPQRIPPTRFRPWPQTGHHQIPEPAIPTNQELPTAPEQPAEPVEQLAEPVLQAEQPREHDEEAATPPSPRPQRETRMPNHLADYVLARPRKKRQLREIVGTEEGTHWGGSGVGAMAS